LVGAGSAGEKSSSGMIRASGCSTISRLIGSVNCSASKKQPTSGRYAR
jgi:hypothetical protein